MTFRKATTRTAPHEGADRAPQGRSVYVRAVLAVALVGLLTGLLTGCAQMSALHLKRNAWEIDTPQVLETKFWRFEYRVMSLAGSHFGVTGWAYPVADRIPEWADHVDELWMVAYLCDAKGGVIAKDLRILLPRTLDRMGGIPLEFILEPEDLGSAGPLSFTLGYRMVLSDSDARHKDTDVGSEDAKPRIFFAKEGALKLF